MSFNSFNLRTNENKSTEYAIVLDSNQSVEEEFDKEVTNPAKEFDFKLDTFQMLAIMHLEKHKNVFVSAHTSAGKTVVADYAIAMAFRSRSKVIYTSPIKALSNQKYRDFHMEFKDVGILTGDVQIKSEASCLVMTTEILLQMLYNKSEVVNELEWVIFDECHYVNDPDRGHVWEEVFILLPENVNLVLLSATVPNVVAFADWLGRTRRRPIYVVSTYKRPVPLEHSLYTSKDNLFLILDSEGKFHEDMYREANDAMNERKGKLKYIPKKPQTERNLYLNLIRYLEKKDKLPVICFTLSRNRCDSNLEMLMAIKKDSFQLTDKSEENKIHKFIWKNLSKLKPSDQELPQIRRVVEMLKRGLGVHHSGVLPILKEITELLFSQGLVKVLFATETFAMGVNMPARTVVFDSIEKHDGNKFRDLKASEYIQMAGRAGRRGKDTTGTVIILCKYDIPHDSRLKIIMKGSASELVSQFRLTYHMILNQHKSAESNQKDIERFLEKSFGEHKRLKESLEISNKLKALQLEIENFAELKCDVCSDDIQNFCFKLEECEVLAEHVMPTICSKAAEKNLLNIGRIVVVKGKSNPFETAIIVGTDKINNKIIALKTISPKSTGDDGYELNTIPIKSLHRILSQQIKNEFANHNLISKLEELSLPNNYKSIDLDFIGPKQLKLTELDFVGVYMRLKNLYQQLISFKCIKCSDFVSHYESMKSKFVIIKNLDELSYKQSNESLTFLPDYLSRIKVLQQKEYMNNHLVLELKGKVGCLMSEHELVITEMLMNNVLGDLCAEEMAALLSCFVFQQKTDYEPNLSEILINKKMILQDISREIATTQIDCGVKYEPIETFVDLLKFGLVEVVYEWAKGKQFVEVLELTNIQEGIIVRCIQRLDELLKFIKLGAKLMGNTELEEKIDSASKCIRRDIVFCPSLYTTTENVIENDEEDGEIDESLSTNFL